MKNQFAKEKHFYNKLLLKWENEINKFKKLNINTTIFRIGLVLSKNEGILKTFKYLQN